MSATSQAFDHYHWCLREGADRKARFWADRLRDLIRQDFPVAGCIDIKLMAPVLLRCSCGDSAMPQSPNALNRFLDRHNQCDRDIKLVWDCATCGGVELNERSRCRFCEAERDEEDGYSIIPSQWTPVLEKLRVYDILLDEGKGFEDAAHVECNSLREAMRAARAMFPKMRWLVHLVDANTQDWGPEHECK